jgi:hypothetical protein
MEPEIGGGSAFLVAVQAAIFLGHSLLSSIQCAQNFLAILENAFG